MITALEHPKPRPKPQPEPVIAVEEPASWKFRVIKTDHDFDEIRNLWEDVLSESEATIFQTFEWQRTWWHHVGRTQNRASLHIILVGQGNKVVGIAPVYEDTVSILGFARARRLLFLGRGSSDYLDLIIRQGFESEVQARLAQYMHLHRHQWDLTLLEDIPNKSHTHRCFQKELANVGFVGSSKATDHCPRITLPSNWDAYLSKLDSNYRRDLRRRERKLTGNFKVTFETIEVPDELDDAFIDLMKLHQYRWEQQGEQGVFAEEKHRSFHQEIAQTFFERGWLLLTFANINGKRVAANYSFRFRGTDALYLLGMGDAGEAMRYSPGRLLICQNIRRAIEKGQLVYDFMRGNEDYKYRLLGSDEPNWTMTMYTADKREARTDQRCHRLRLLYESSMRRISREVLGFIRMIHLNGFLSQRTFSYVTARPSLLIRDARKKVKEPDKPLYVRF